MRALCEGKRRDNVLIESELNLAVDAPKRLGQVLQQLHHAQQYCPQLSFRGYYSLLLPFDTYIISCKRLDHFQFAGAEHERLLDFAIGQRKDLTKFIEVN